MLFHAVPATRYQFRGFLVNIKPEKSCVQKGADCCPRALKTLFQGPCNEGLVYRSIKMKIRIEPVEDKNKTNKASN